MTNPEFKLNVLYAEPAHLEEIADVPDIRAYAIGICYASVCSNKSVEETTRYLNEQHPVGIDLEWKLANEPFASGFSNPSPCNVLPESGRLHYLFVFVC